MLGIIEAVHHSLHVFRSIQEPAAQLFITRWRERVVGRLIVEAFARVDAQHRIDLVEPFLLNMGAIASNK